MSEASKHTEKNEFLDAIAEVKEFEGTLKLHRESEKRLLNIIQLLERERDVAEERLQSVVKALKSAGAVFARIFAETATSGTDYGFPKVAKWCQEESCAIIGALALCNSALSEPCQCYACNPKEHGTRMFTCNTCGNKRCPHATSHEYECTNSNEPGQAGSLYSSI